VVKQRLGLIGHVESCVACHCRVRGTAHRAYHDRLPWHGRAGSWGRGKRGEASGRAGRRAANEQDTVSARTHRPRGGGASRGSAVVIRQRRRARTDARTCWLALRVHEALAASQPRQLRGALRRPYRMKHRSTNAPQSSLSPPPPSLLLPPLLLPLLRFCNTRFVLYR
jgi:hypothetical protein